MPDVDYLVETEKALDTFIATKEQQRRFKKLDGNSFIQAVAMFVSSELDPLRKEIAKLKDRLAEIEAKGIEFSGSWQRAVEYRRGAMVVHDGSLFACIEATSPNETPGNSSKWVLCAKGRR
jgi:hypothetical protein